MGRLPRVLSFVMLWSSSAIGTEDVPCCDSVELTAQHILIAENVYGISYSHLGYVCGKFVYDIDDCCLADAQGNRRYKQEDCVPESCDDGGSDVRGKQVTCGGKCPTAGAECSERAARPPIVCQVYGNNTNAHCCGCGKIDEDWFGVWVSMAACAIVWLGVGVY